MTTTRRTFRRWAAGVLAGLVTAVSSCALLPPQPVPLVPFGDFTLTTTGGIAGIYRQLRISADGSGLLLTEDPAAGRISRPTLERLRTLLESERLRQDVARLGGDTGPQQCSDAFQTTLRMGELSATRTDTCGRVPTPALDELGEVVRPFWDGDFEEPLPDGPPPPRIVIQEVRSGRPSTKRVELESGRASLFASDRTVRTEQLDPQQVEALQVLATAPPCLSERNLDDGYLVRIGDQQSESVIGGRVGPDCTELSTIAAIGLDAVDS
jgi:hypothetical protein